MKLPLVASRISQHTSRYGALFTSQDFWSLRVIVLNFGKTRCRTAFDAESQSTSSEPAYGSLQSRCSRGSLPNSFVARNTLIFTSN